jgi:microcystin-dependent protein
MAAGSDQFVGEIRIFPFQLIPPGWLPCNGQLLKVDDPPNRVLYALIRNTFGGNGHDTFGLPDLRGAIPMGTGVAPNRTSRDLGDKGGKEDVSLLEVELPSHRHTLAAQGVDANSSGPGGKTFARASGSTPYAPGVAVVPMDLQAIGEFGEGFPHNNVQPYLALNFCIALDGVYPRPG